MHNFYNYIVARVHNIANWMFQMESLKRTNSAQPLLKSEPDLDNITE